jgi:ABC-type branched-subunit amino acid transport system substrate-binding protein
MTRTSLNRFFGLGLAVSALTGLVLACSDDETTATSAPKSDAGTDSTQNVSETGGPAQCAPAATPTCTAAKCTTDMGEPAVCVSGTCVKMKTADCPKVGGDLEGANVIVIGALLAQNGANKASGESRINSLELAINEVNKAGGVPDPDRCKPSRTLAYVACDDANIAGTPVDAGADSGVDASVANVIDRIRGGKHLTDDLKVAAIVGGSTSGNTLDIAKNISVPAKVMQFAPSSTAISITAPTDFNASPDGTRLLWRAAPSDVVQSVVLQKVFLALEAGVKSGGVASPKLAFVTKNDAYGKGIAQAFKAGLVVNGTAIPNANFQEWVYKTNAGDADGVLRATVVTDLIAFQPDIIVMAGTSEATDDIVRPYEANANTTKPIYLFADGQKKPELTALLDPADTKQPAPLDRTNLRARIRGTQPGVLTPLAQSFFNISYKSAYGADAILSYGMAGTYDIAYMLTYAIAATKGGPIDGTTLAKNMALLSSGTRRIDVGPVALKDGFESMLKAEKVDFNGASGPLDFDPATGEAPSDYGIWCVKLDPQTSKPIFEEATGQSYSAKDAKLVGTFACP